MQDISFYVNEMKRDTETLELITEIERRYVNEFLKNEYGIFFTEVNQQQMTGVQFRFVPVLLVAYSVLRVTSTLKRKNSWI